MMGPFKTTASMVRTGHVICVPWDGYRKQLEVEIVHHERFTMPDTGEVADTVAYTGWCNGKRVEAGWRQRRDTKVLVVEDLRGWSYRTLGRGVEEAV